MTQRRRGRSKERPGPSHTGSHGGWWQLPLVLALLAIVTVGGSLVATRNEESTEVASAGIQAASGGAAEAPAGEAHSADGSGSDGVRAVSADSTKAPSPPLPPSSQRSLDTLTTIGGEISPKSVVHSGDGYFVAQNMMYRHTITLYDRAFNLVATIPDTVRLSDFGFDEYSGEYQGAPVEAAFTNDGGHAYVSNYEMYGAGFSNPGGDNCGDTGWDESFVYRVDVAAAEIDQVIAVGSVPKYVAVTPDDSTVLVTNWCSYDLSVIDADRGIEVQRVDIGRFPRGIAVSPDGSTAYIAVMGSIDIAVVSLTDYSVSWFRGVGGSPRHLVLSPDGDHLYVTLNRDGTIAKLDAESGEQLGVVATGRAPRSMTIADDGEALYVVNYEDGTVSKVLTTDMVEVQEIGVGYHPIGITYDAGEGNVWVANYGGSISVLADR